MKDTPVLDAARTVGPEDRDAIVGIVQALAREVGDKLERILVLLEPLPRIDAAIADLTKRMQSVERDGHRRDDMLDNHDKRLAALEAAKKPKRKARK